MGTETVLSVLAAVEGFIGILLSGHSVSASISFPALLICRALGSGSSRAVAGTVFGFVALLLAVALNDLRALLSITSKAAENPEHG